MLGFAIRGLGVCSFVVCVVACSAGSGGDSSRGRPLPEGEEGPVITNVQTTSDGGSVATVTWTTDEPASSIIDFGLTGAYGSTAQDLTLATNHGPTLSG